MNSMFILYFSGFLVIAECATVRGPNIDKTDLVEDTEKNETALNRTEYFDNHKYVLSQEMTSWFDASLGCKEISGNLASINSREELQFLEKHFASVLYGTWIGLRFLPTARIFHEWDNGDLLVSPKWWEKRQDNITGCASISSLEYKLMMYADLGNCSTPRRYLCEIVTDSWVPTLDYDKTPTEDLLTFAGSKSLYKVVPVPKSWTEAEEICAESNGHLYSLRDFKFQESLRWSWANTTVPSTAFHWTGIYLERNGDLYWSNGSYYSSVKHEHWFHVNDTEPNRKYCVASSRNGLTFQNFPCDALLPYICEYEDTKVQADRHMKDSSYISPYTECKNIPILESNHLNESQWRRCSFRDRCFHIDNSFSKKNWTSAEAHCNYLKGNLASIDSYELNYWLSRRLPRPIYWIGGYIEESKLLWSDTREVTYTNFQRGEPNNFYLREKCISYHAETGGMWNDEWCSKKLPYICQVPCYDFPKKSKLNGPRKAIRNELLAPNHIAYDDRFSFVSARNSSNMENETEIHTVSCFGNWTKMGRSCVRIGDRSMSFNEAENYCKTLHPKGHLVSIGNETEEEIFSFLLMKNYSPVWIGLFREGFWSKFVWTDGSSILYENWILGGPGTDVLVQRSIDENCVSATSNHYSKGSWMNVDCNLKLRPACARPFYAYDSEHKICKGLHNSFLKYGYSCYGIFDAEHKTWKDANEHCRSLNSTMLSINDLMEQKYIGLNFLPVNSDTVWLGVNFQEMAKFLKWSNGYPITYRNWDTKAVPVTMNNECGALSLRSGSWMLQPCEKKQAFVCEHNLEKMESLPPDVDGHCPNSSWIDIGGVHCYFIEEIEKVPWEEANERCISMGGSLASLHSSIENKFLTALISTQDDTAWIGLHKSVQNEFVWSDWTDMEYLNWKEGEPSGNSENCVEMSADSYWNDISCQSIRSYICKMEKIVYITKTRVPVSGSAYEKLMDHETPVVEGFPSNTIEMSDGP